mmetsp:Transcript_15763/g.21634  ORF Transcript_15763/g.21634 Transcript_15763/m.21634 type:complete len:305 (-) Transcript_15763:100-1014(-)|eukprot:CAMPEP_0185730984 /NCGR_PEP_ID=MMETSP1171-20130828/11509_1 /TAXON_ID=374046 /ORGANISM="Helicotheca tamensis, Strain CCMP826" /LENGTH=304 /DNA_ID=CAMNT_0028400139 /DNA_START=198 /DNA_END=1112 /DNA_ORIENTATION=-
MGNTDSSSAHPDDEKAQTTETTTAPEPAPEPKPEPEQAPELDPEQDPAPEPVPPTTPTSTKTTNDFKLDLTHDSNGTGTTSRRASARKKTAPSSGISPGHRRVVKATQPPPLEDEGEGTGASSSPTTMTDEDERGTRGLVPAKSPSVEDREMSEKLRQKRLDAAAAFSKGKKEKDLEQRRKSVADSGEVAAADSGGETSSSVSKTPLPAILSVEPQFPEHKRTVDTASLPPDEAPSEKRVKIDNVKDEDGTEDKDTTRSLTFPGSDLDESSWTDGISKLAKLAVPAVTVVAVVAIVAMKVTRKK